MDVKTAILLEHGAITELEGQRESLEKIAGAVKVEPEVLLEIAALEE